MQRIFLVSTLVLLLAQMAAAQFKISGKVSNANGEALVGAAVQLNNQTVATADGGVFVFEDVPSGNQILKVTFIGFQPYSTGLEVEKDGFINVVLSEKSFYTNEIVVSAIKAKPTDPVAYSELTKEQIAQNNYGQDMPYLLAQTPGMVVNSDVGAGVGYTGLRLRGTDISRINITVNGIPLNDAESQGVYWVNMPDFASSVEQVQVQRGVGTSTNGAASFGGSINMTTLNGPSKASVIVDNSYGSYNTLRNSASVNTGLLNDRYAFEMRLSQLSSDGYIDRATSDLKSFYFSAGYYGDATTLRFVTFSGKEKTYQSWNGVPKVKLENDVDGMNALLVDASIAGDGWSAEEAANLFASDAKTFNRYLYNNQTDNYKQDHYQLHLSHKANNNLSFNGALHYTHGEGYYESYKYDQAFTDYGFPYESLTIDGAVVASTDLIAQKWLDNDFYGVTGSATYQNNGLNLVTGGALNQYDGRHFGDVVWAAVNNGVANNYQWYESTGLKTDFNWYAKANVDVTEGLSAYADAQYRYVKHVLDGTHDDMSTIDRKMEFNFFNPKVGVNYQLSMVTRAYASFAISNREPSRNDVRDADAGKLPKAEHLADIEAGFETSTDRYAFQINGFFMNYKDQLVLTGEVNNVGAPIMANVPESYRAGVELIGGLKLARNLKWTGNVVLSANKIKNFTEYVDNWLSWFDETQPAQFVTELGTTDIAFSPNVTAASNFTYTFFKNWRTSLLSRYVGKQYVDNSSNDSRSLDAYFINDWTINYATKIKGFAHMDIGLQVNNLLSEDYIANAWVYNYYDTNLNVETQRGERTTMDGYFTQAPRNVMMKLVLTF